MIIAKLVLVVVIGYILGSIPFGVLIGIIFSKVDVRSYGSGKMGTTNVLRVAGKKAAIIVGLLDVSKGAIAVIIAGFIFSGKYFMVEGSTMWWLAKVSQAAAALAAIAGHNWPIFLRFHGGRGVATFFGGLIALCPWAAIFGAEVLLLGAGLTRFVSFGSIVGMLGAVTILVPLTVFSGFPLEYLIYALIGSAIIIYMHRDNIARLIAGTERRLGEKVSGSKKRPG